MDVAQALNVAAQSQIEGLHGLYPKAAQVLADEVNRRHGIGMELLNARAERDDARRKLSAYQDAVVEVLLEHCDDEEIEAPELKRLIDERAAAELGS